MAQHDHACAVELDGFTSSSAESANRAGNGPARHFLAGLALVVLRGSDGGAR